MGISLADAGEWDFVEYAKVLPVFNERQKFDGENDAGDEVEAPSIEWMIADDVRAHERGHKVH